MPTRQGHLGAIDHGMEIWRATGVLTQETA